MIVGCIVIEIYIIRNSEDGAISYEAPRRIGTNQWSAPPFLMLIFLTQTMILGDDGEDLLSGVKNSG